MSPCFLTFLCFLTVNHVISADYITVTTSYGQVRGQVDKQMSLPVNTFYGIPYAAAPVGPRRFQPPVEPSPWSNVKDALRFGPECYQQNQQDFRFNNSGEEWRMSEDCLYLNVYSPYDIQQVRRAHRLVCFGHQILQIRNILRSNFRTFWLDEPFK